MEPVAPPPAKAESSPRQAAILQAELLARGITRAARADAQRILAAAIDAAEGRDGLVRQAGVLHKFAIDGLDGIQPSAVATARDIQVDGNALAREVLAQAERDVAQIQAETQKSVSALVQRVERRAARLERRGRRFRVANRSTSSPHRMPWRAAGALVAVVLVAGATGIALSRFSVTPERAEATLDATLPSGAPPPCPIPERFQKTFASAARASDLPLPLLAALADTESGFDPRARSQAGAIGLLQLMPQTGRILQIDPANPRQNIGGGARYLRHLIDELGGLDPALAAYHAGPSASKASTFGNDTVRYVDSVKRRQRAFGGCA